MICKQNFIHDVQVGFRPLSVRNLTCLLHWFISYDHQTKSQRKFFLWFQCYCLTCTFCEENFQKKFYIFERSVTILYLRVLNYVSVLLLPSDDSVCLPCCCCWLKGTKKELKVGWMVKEKQEGPDWEGKRWRVWFTIAEIEEMKTKGKW